MTLALRPAAVPDSPLARWDGRWKLAAVVALAAAAATLRTPAAAGAAAMIALALTRAGNLPPRRVLARVALLIFAVLPFLIVLPFTVDNGTAAALAVGLRCLTVGILALVLAGTAAPPDTFAAAHSLGVPGALVQVARLAHRYGLELFAEARRVRTAMRCRGFRVHTSRHSYRALGHLAGAVLVRGGDRAERVAAAMRARGFDGTPRTAVEFRTTALDVFGTVAAIAVAVLLVLWDRGIV